MGVRAVFQVHDRRRFLGTAQSKPQLPIAKIDLIASQKNCGLLHPPGRKVYQRGAHTIWEVDGAKSKVSTPTH